MVGYKRADGAVLVTTANNGPIQQVTNQRAAIMGPPAWSADGQSIVFSSTKAGEPSLWKAPAGGGEATQIEGTGTATWHPTVARKDGKLVVQKILRSSSIYRVDLEENGAQHSRTVVTSTNGRNEGPQLSPDGKKLLFMSDRSGSLEIWESNPDGSAAVQLTNLRGCGTPRWAPDGMWIAFDTVGNGAQGVYVISAMGGTPRALAMGGSENSVPSWSRDGKWIYFASNRSGQDQVWKVPADGGIFFCPPEAPNERPTIDFYDFGTRLTRQISLLDRSPFWLSSTPNGREVFYNQAEQDGSSILLVESYK